VVTQNASPTLTTSPTGGTSAREFIVTRPGYCGGKPHVAGHRIKVQQIAVWHERMGMTANEIVATYPTLSLAAVYAALSYYHDHRAEIDADITADEDVVLRAKAMAGPSLVGQKIASAHAENRSLPS
jgi:uncharacterized protein (DUF433 family)